MSSSKVAIGQAGGPSFDSIRNAAPATCVKRGQILGSAWFKTVLFSVSDLLSIFLSHEIAERLTLRWLRIPVAVFDPPHYSLFYLPFLVSIFFLLGGYKQFDFRRPERELELCVKAISFFFLVLLTANFVVFKSWEFSRYLIVCWYIATLVLTTCARFILRGIYSHLWRSGIARQNALVFGSADRLKALHEKLAVQRHRRYEIVGALVPGSQKELSGIHPWAILGSADDWEEISHEHHVQWILHSAPESENSQTKEVLNICRQHGIGVELYSEMFSDPEYLYEKDEFSGYFRFSSRPLWAQTAHKGIKVLGETFVAGVGSFLTILMIPFIALLLKLEDGGPVFYRREFVDCDGRICYYLKFRSMIQRADETLNKNSALKMQYAEKHKLQEDPRVLRVGKFLRKFSIDEFPQFFSVLNGRLALIGPRVISAEERGRYGESLSKLLSVKPGMTGYWQVMGRQNTDYDERVRMDMFYIDHWSLWLDLVIFGKTFWKVLRAEGAC
ncbi:MAG TPA: exopolysaccharide biosynthesis polyprenyl glycosylphosphotransferase [Terriglobales bacterium]